jgi:adenosylmethionine-8-amino-7-oxononanoate aminotransferase
MSNGSSMPSDRTTKLTALDHRHVWHPFTQQSEWTRTAPLIIERAEECWLVDVEGRRYLDGVSSLWTNVHGHRHPALDAAVRAQLDRVAHSTMLGLTHPTAIELAAALVAKAPPGLTRVFYSDNGSTAVEVALKMAYQAQQQRGETERVRFAALRDAYHGDTLGAVSVGAIDIFHAVYKPLLFDCVALPAPVEPGGSEEAACLEQGLALLDAHGSELAALVVEPLVQGAAGMKMHSTGFLRTLLQRARELGVLIVADEVAVGFGRTGTLFAMEQVGLSPDFLCLAKGLAGGYLPLAATLSTEAIYEAFLAAPEAGRQFFHGHTFTGNPLACAVALASLDLFHRADRLAQADRIAEQLSVRLAPLRAHPGVSSIRQRGVMIGIDLVQRSGLPYPAARRIGAAVCHAARAHGLILRPLGDTVVINPPLALTHDDVDHLMRALHAALDQESV